MPIKNSHTGKCHVQNLICKIGLPGLAFSESEFSTKWKQTSRKALPLFASRRIILTQCMYDILIERFMCVFNLICLHSFFYRSLPPSLSLAFLSYFFPRPNHNATPAFMHSNSEVRNEKLQKAAKTLVMRIS